MATFTIDGSRIQSQEQFWKEYLAIVQPDGAEVFGRNLAAFNDALWGGPGWPGDDFTLQIVNSHQLSTAVGGDFLTKIREICDNSHSAKLELL